MAAATRETRLFTLRMWQEEQAMARLSGAGRCRRCRKAKPTTSATGRPWSRTCRRCSAPDVILQMIWGDTMILIVGASGKLGQAVARRALQAGRAVRALSRRPEERLIELKAAGAEVMTAICVIPTHCATPAQASPMWWLRRTPSWPGRRAIGPR